MKVFRFDHRTEWMQIQLHLECPLKSWMRSHPGVTATFFAAMSDAGVNIEMISTSEIRISIVCRESDLDRAVKAAHTAFELDADQIEAVVYGGTGR